MQRHPDEDSSGFCRDQGWCRQCGAVIRMVGLRWYGTDSYGPCCSIDCLRVAGKAGATPDYVKQHHFELRACPACGSAAHVVTGVGAADPMLYVTGCICDGAYGPGRTGTGATRQEAQAAWNKYVDDTLLALDPNDPANMISNSDVRGGVEFWDDPRLWNDPMVYTPYPPLD